MWKHLLLLVACLAVVLWFVVDNPDKYLPIVLVLAPILVAAEWLLVKFFPGYK